MKIMRSAIDQIITEEVAALKMLEEDISMEELRSIYEKHYEREPELNAKNPEGHREIRFEMFGDGFFDGLASERSPTGQNFFGTNADWAKSNMDTPVSEDYMNGYNHATNGKAQEHYEQMQAASSDGEQGGRALAAQLATEFSDDEGLDEGLGDWIGDKWDDATEWADSKLKGWNDLLDFAGMAPWIGAPADALSFIIYLLRRQWYEAAIAFACIVPVAGQAVASARFAKKVGAAGVDAASKYRKAKKAASASTADDLRQSYMTSMGAKATTVASKAGDATTIASKADDVGATVSKADGDGNIIAKAKKIIMKAIEQYEERSSYKSLRGWIIQLGRADLKRRLQMQDNPHWALREYIRDNWDALNGALNSWIENAEASGKDNTGWFTQGLKDVRSTLRSLTGAEDKEKREGRAELVEPILKNKPACLKIAKRVCIRPDVSGEVCTNLAMYFKESETDESCAALPKDFEDDYIKHIADNAEADKEANEGKMRIAKGRVKQIIQEELDRADAIEGE